MTDDEQLLAELAEAMRAARDVPVRFVEAGKAAFGWLNVDAELAELTYDSTTAPADAGTRADPATLQAMTFAAAGLTIEVEITATALQGQIVPPQAGEIELQPRDGPTIAVPVDEVGWFVFTPHPAGSFRLRLRTTAGAHVLTEWITY